MALDAGTVQGKLDLDHTSFDRGFSEAHSHAQEEGGKIREQLEAISEVFTEALGPAAEQFGHTLQSAFAGFSEGGVIGTLNLVGTAAGTARELVESVGGRFHALDLAAEKAGVSVEWLSKLAGVGGTVGVGLDQLSMSFRMLEERAAQASQGEKSAVEGFQRLGISASEAAALMEEPEKLFRRVQEAIGGIGAASLRTQAAHDVLGRSGTALIPVLRMSNDEFERQAEIIGKLGGTINEGEGQLGATFGKLEGYLDALKVGVEKAFAVPILQYFEDHLDGITKRLEGASNWVKQNAIPAVTEAARDTSFAAHAGADAARSLVPDNVGVLSDFAKWLVTPTDLTFGLGEKVGNALGHAVGVHDVNDDPYDVPGRASWTSHPAWVGPHASADEVKAWFAGGFQAAPDPASFSGSSIGAGLGAASPFLGAAVSLKNISDSLDPILQNFRELVDDLNHLPSLRTDRGGTTTHPSRDAATTQPSSGVVIQQLHIHNESNISSAQLGQRIKDEIAKAQEQSSLQRNSRQAVIRIDRSMGGGS